jgi:hypothetical protein
MPIRFRSAQPVARGEVVVDFNLVFAFGTSISVQVPFGGIFGCRSLIVYPHPSIYHDFSISHFEPCSEERSAESRYAPESDIARKHATGAYNNLEYIPKNGRMAQW